MLCISNANYECDQTHLLPPISLVSSSVISPLLFSSQASHLSASLWCSGTASEACGRSAKPGPGFGAGLLSVERDPGPLRPKGRGWRVEGVAGGRQGGEGGEPRQRAVQFWITFKELQSQRRDWIPLRREGEKRGSVRGERERERHGRHETRGKCEKRKERSGLGCNFFPTLPLSFSLPLSLSLHGVHALALHAAAYTEMIYLCARAGRHGKSGPHKGVVVPPWSFL